MPTFSSVSDFGTEIARVAISLDKTLDYQQKFSVFKLALANRRIRPLCHLSQQLAILHRPAGSCKPASCACRIGNAAGPLYSIFAIEHSGSP
jgi:hypothetical protein